MASAQQLVERLAVDLDPHDVRRSGVVPRVRLRVVLELELREPPAIRHADELQAAVRGIGPLQRHVERPGVVAVTHQLAERVRESVVDVEVGGPDATVDARQLAAHVGAGIEALRLDVVRRADPAAVGLGGLLVLGGAAFQFIGEESVTHRPTPPRRRRRHPA